MKPMKTNKKMYLIGAIMLTGQIFLSAHNSLSTPNEEELNPSQFPQYEQELQMGEEQSQFGENMAGEEGLLSENEQEFIPEQQELLDENFPQEEEQYVQYDEEQPLDEQQQLEEEGTYPQGQQNQ